MLTLLIAIGVVTSAPPAEPDSATAIRKIVERGIEAQGGEQQLEKLSKPWRGKVKGKAGMLDCTGEMLHQSSTQSKVSTVLHAGPLSTEVVVVSNGEKTWNRIAGFTNEVTGKDLEEMKDGNYRHHVQNLLPLLREQGIELSLLPETSVSGQPAAGIRVRSNGHRDIDLYFDKGTGLMVKTESRIRQAGKPEIVLEKILSNYRDFDGLKLPTKFTKFENQKQTSVEEFVGITFVDHIDDREFEKP
jgi:hypothetical protein